MMKNMFDFFKRFNGAWTLICGLLFFGLILTLVPGALIFFNSKKQIDSLYGFWLPAAGKLGQTLLAAGCFAAFLKAFQFIGVFNDAIKSLMTSDPEFKTQFHDLIFSRQALDYASHEKKIELWKNLSSNLYCNDRRKLIDIDSKFVDKMWNSYFSNSIDFIQRDFTVEYDIKFDNGDVVYIEKASYDIIPLRESFDFRTTYMVWKSLHEGLDNSALKIKKFSIAGTEFAERFAKAKQTEPTFEIYKQVLQVNLKNELGAKFGPQGVNVKSIIEMRNTPIRSPHFRYQFSQYTMGFKIDYRNNNPDELNVKLELVDDRIDLREVLAESTGLENKNELLLPTDGYLLIVTPKKWTNEKSNV